MFPFLKRLLFRGRPSVPAYTAYSAVGRTAFNPESGEQATHADAVITLGVFSGRQWELTQVSWSYSAAPAGGQLVIAWTDAGGTSRNQTYDIIAGGPNSLLFPPSLTLPATVAPTITLKDGGAGIVGRVYCIAGRI